MRELVSQSSAARLKGVSRQRINELIKLGRISLATDKNGKSGLWLDEVEALEIKAVGRPRLSDEDRRAREPKFKVGDRIWWMYASKHSGLAFPIRAEVVKIAPKRLKATYKLADGTQKTVWVDQDICGLDVKEARASDNEKIPESGKIGYSLNYHEKLKARMI